MQRLALASLLAVAVAAAAPRSAHAEIGLRLGLEAPLVTHQNSRTVTVGGSTVTVGGGTSTFADSLQPSLTGLLSYYPPGGIVGFDIEVLEGFAHTGDNYRRLGTAIGPGITVSPPVIPIYLRASLPIHLEPDDVFFGVRAAAGLSLNLAVLSLYLEGAVDFPLAGTNNDAFSRQTLSLGGGVWFKF